MARDLKRSGAEYQAWASMKQRCYNRQNTRYEKYGARGIVVCRRWINSFDDFYHDMGKRPSPQHSLDRINNNGNYEPGNCRWATRSQQQKNKNPGNTKNLIRGDKHWTRIERERAAAIGRKNIKNTHGSGENNNRAKMTFKKAKEMRRVYAGAYITMAELGNMFGVGRETARKIVRGVAWK